MSDLYTKMLTLKPDEIYEAFASEYIFEFGEAAKIEITSKVGYADAVGKYIDSLILSGRLPNETDVSALLVSSSYFMFAKSEKLCLGGLILIIFWKESAEFNILSYKAADLSKVMCDLIILCSKMKFSKRDNFFERFYDSINTLTKGTLLSIKEKHTTQDNSSNSEINTIDLNLINSDNIPTNHTIAFFNAQINRVLTSTETEILALIHFTSGPQTGKMDVAFRKCKKAYNDIEDGDSVIIKAITNSSSELIINEFKKQILTKGEFYLEINNTDFSYTFYK